jgi:hypothetical protein
MDPSLDAPDDEDCTNSRPRRVVYDRNLCVQMLAKRNSLTLKEAGNEFESNIAAEYIGANTPLFVNSLNVRKGPKKP